ncbi:hypothetical protein J6590_097845 [Homalodisca vitripennis]|nr:hypothetical protein J6590_097845 [Homalodisca vitripennis]
MFQVGNSCLLAAGTGFGTRVSSTRLVAECQRLLPLNVLVTQEVTHILRKLRHGKSECSNCHLWSSAAIEPMVVQKLRYFKVEADPLLSLILPVLMGQNYSGLSLRTLVPAPVTSYRRLGLDCLWLHLSIHMSIDIKFCSHVIFEISWEYMEKDIETENTFIHLLAEEKNCANLLSDRLQRRSAKFLD